MTALIFVKFSTTQVFFHHFLQNFWNRLKSILLRVYDTVFIFSLHLTDIPILVLLVSYIVRIYEEFMLFYRKPMMELNPYIHNKNIFFKILGQFDTYF